MIWIFHLLSLTSRCVTAVCGGYVNFISPLPVKLEGTIVLIAVGHSFPILFSILFSLWFIKWIDNLLSSLILSNVRLHLSFVKIKQEMK